MHDVTVPGPYALRRAREIYGSDVSRNALNYFFGTRTDPKDWKAKAQPNTKET